MKFFIWTTAMVAIAALGACQMPPDDEATGATVATEHPALQPKEGPKPIKAARPEIESAAAPSKPDLCWQDYCPCDHPETALDHTICRNARAGVEMSDDQWSIGASARDMKHESDELTRQANEGIADINAHRIHDRGD